MKDLACLDFSKYKLFIFDWDGTLLDSQDSYMEWDQLFVKTFYGVDWPLENFHKLAKKMKVAGKKGTESVYFRFLDEKFGDGSTPIDVIWENIYSLAPVIQAKNDYMQNAPEFLEFLRSKYNARIALCTSSERRDIEFYASKESKTALTLNPVAFFDKIITLDDVSSPKPDPEPYKVIIKEFQVEAAEALVFEDSQSGVVSAKLAGADVVSIGEIENADYSILTWADAISITKKERV